MYAAAQVPLESVLFCMQFRCGNSVEYVKAVVASDNELTEPVVINLSTFMHKMCLPPGLEFGFKLMSVLALGIIVSKSKS